MLVYIVHRCTIQVLFCIFWGTFYEKEKNLFSIGEIAKALGVTRRIILNYEQRGLIQPDIKEGTTGNRYYTIDSFTKLRSIRIFQNLGLSLDEIRAYFNDSSDILPLIRRLEKLRDELNLNIEKLYERVQTGEAQIKTIRLERQRIYAAAITAKRLQSERWHCGIPL